MQPYKDDADEAMHRVEAWWRREVLDRVVIQVTAPRREREPEPLQVQDPERYLTDPEIVIPRLRRQLESTYFGGESFPVMFPVAVGMVAILANYLGSPMRFVNTHTVWAEPIIHDWDARPELKFDPANRYWQMSKRLFEAAREQADGCHLGIPDLNGPTEVLSRLRSPQKLALDFVDQPERIKPALKEINQAWLRAWQECTAFTQPTGGYFYWMQIWSDLPSVDLQSDFSCMISSRMFNEYFLPFIEEQTRMVDRTIYHLDGPGALHHLDALLELPRLNGIQWVPGAGAPPAVHWLPLLRRIQGAGKLVVCYSDSRDVEALVRALDPRGLMIVTSCASVEEAEDLLRRAETWTARAA